MVLPLTLTLLSEAFPAGRRGVALGIWSGVSGLGVALGPVIGGAVVSGISWHWIFWLNVPIGLVVAPLALARLTESHGPNRRLDLPGVVLASGGLLGVVYALVRANALGWTSPTIVGAAAAGAVLLAALRRLGAARARADAADAVLPQPRVLGDQRASRWRCTSGCSARSSCSRSSSRPPRATSPLQAGLRTLPWTAMPIFVAPLAGLLSDRIGARPLMFAGLALQAVALGWLATRAHPDARLRPR